MEFLFPNTLPRLSTYSPGAGGVEHTSYSCSAHQPRPCLACFCSLLYCSPKSVHSDLSLLSPRVHWNTLAVQGVQQRRAWCCPNVVSTYLWQEGGSKRGGKERGVVKQSQSQSADSASQFLCWWLTLAMLSANWLKIKVIKTRHFCLRKLLRLFNGCEV